MNFEVVKHETTCMKQFISVFRGGEEFPFDFPNIPIQHMFAIF